MKKLFMSMFAVLVFCLCFITACGPSGLENNPDKNLTAVGNGGLAVVKGDYLYYINGFQDYKAYTNVKTDNQFGSIERSAIYRTKLVNGKVSRNENGMLNETECVVPHTVGFDKGGFYIVGNYIYYLTPHMENALDSTTGGKVLKNDWSDICRINIDGTGQVRLNYTSNDSRVSDWAVYTIDDKAYIVLLDGNDLICVDGESGSAMTMATGVASMARLEQENFVYGQDNLNEYTKYIYYTREYTENDSENGKAGNKLCKVAINTTEEVVVACDMNNNYELVDYINGSVYYTKTVDSEVSWAASIYRRDVQTNEEVRVCDEYTSHIVLDNNNTNNTDNKLVVVDSNNYMYLINNNSRKVIYTGSNSITFVGENNGKVYFIEDSKIYYLDYVNDSEPVLISDEDKTYKIEDANLIDFDGRRFYVYAEYKASDDSSNYYLNVYDSFDTETDSDFVGKFVEGETPAEPEAEENEDGETEKEQWIK